MLYLLLRYSDIIEPQRREAAARNAMYEVFITGFRLVEEPDTKPYYVYSVEVVHPNNSIRYSVEKRYSEFNTLHRMVNSVTHFISFIVYVPL